MKSIIRALAIILILLSLAVLPVVAVDMNSSEEISTEDESWREKLSFELEDIMESMSEEDTCNVICMRYSLESEEIEAEFKVQTGYDWQMLRAANSEEYEIWVASVLAAKEEELGLAPGGLNQNEGEGLQAIFDASDSYRLLYEDIEREMYAGYEEEFLERHGIDPSRKNPYYGALCSDVFVKATKAEIISMAEDDSCISLLYDDRVFEDEEDIDDDFDFSHDESGDYSEDELISIESFAINLNGDVNADGEVNSLDAALVLKYDAGLIDEFANKAPEYVLSEEAEAQLCRGYYDYYDSQYSLGIPFEESGVEILSYYGNHSGCEVAYFSDYILEDTLAYETHIIAGYVFEYTTGRQIQVYKDGEVYDLTEAYDNGLLTAEDIYKIAIHRGTSPVNTNDRDDSAWESLGLYYSVKNVFGDANFDRMVDNLDAAWILKFDAGLIE